MAIFKINNKKVKQLNLKQNGFKNEFELRDFFADNLLDILGVRFIAKEYPIPEGQIDTLGIDENNTPVIIEYKKKDKEDVLSQGLHYFLWLKKNKNHFELLVKNKLGNQAEINWEEPRVILIAQRFSRYIKSAVQLNKNVELKTYVIYEDNILHIENEYSPSTEREQSDKKKNNAKDETAYDLKYHLDITTPEMQKVVLLLRDKIRELPSVEEKAEQKSGITYRTTKSFARLEFRPTWVQLLILEPHYNSDVKKIIKDITSNKWWYKGLVKFTPDSNVDYIFSLVRASYNSTL